MNECYIDDIELCEQLKLQIDTEWHTDSRIVTYPRRSLRRRTLCKNKHSIHPRVTQPLRYCFSALKCLPKKNKTYIITAVVKLLTVWCL